MRDKIFWDFKIKMDKTIPAKKPNLYMVKKKRIVS